MTSPLQYLHRNPYQSGAQKVIPATLIYAFYDDFILMIQKKDSGKWNGLGGKLELFEAPRTGAAREFQEEAGLDLPPETFQTTGVLQFPDFMPHKKEDWWVTVFILNLKKYWPKHAPFSPPETGSRSQSTPGTEPILIETDEGSLHWVHQTALLQRPIWTGDELFIPYVIDKQPFFGTIWYQDGKPHRHEFVPFALNSSEKSPHYPT